MNSIRPYPLDKNGAAWLSNVGQTVNSHNLTAGKGITIHKTSHGMQIAQTADRNINYINNKGYYSFDTEYWTGDLVYVDPNAIYKDQNGATLTIAGGGYICVNHVPQSSNTSTYFLASIVPAFVAAGGGANDAIANTYRWYNKNNYQPSSLYSASMVATTVDVASGYNIYTSQSFWMPIGGVSTNASTSSRVIFNPSVVYTAGQEIIVLNTTMINSVVVPAGCFFCYTTLTTAGTGSCLPQYPEPISGSVYWYLESFRPQPLAACTNTSQSWVNASSPISI
jgi:hypothetical protein